MVKFFCPMCTNNGQPANSGRRHCVISKQIDRFYNFRTRTISVFKTRQLYHRHSKKCFTKSTNQINDAYSKLISNPKSKPKLKPKPKAATTKAKTNTKIQCRTNVKIVFECPYGDCSAFSTKCHLDSHFDLFHPHSQEDLHKTNKLQFICNCCNVTFESCLQAAKHSYFCWTDHNRNVAVTEVNKKKTHLS